MLGNRSKAIKLVTPALAIAGWLATNLPGTAASPYYYDADVNATYYNEYRVCAARLLKAGLAAEAGAQACSTAARPGDLSSCVYRIKQQTQISPIEALPACRQAWNPTELARCVVGINKNGREAVDPTASCGTVRQLVMFRGALGLTSAQIPYFWFSGGSPNEVDRRL